MYLIYSCVRCIVSCVYLTYTHRFKHSVFSMCYAQDGGLFTLGSANHLHHQLPPGTVERGRKSSGSAGGGDSGDGGSGDGAVISVDAATSESLSKPAHSTATSTLLAFPMIDFVPLRIDAEHGHYWYV